MVKLLALTLVVVLGFVACKSDEEKPSADAAVVVGDSSVSSEAGVPDASAKDAATE